MKIYTVTFCGMDGEADANPLWHTSLLLSQYDENLKKLEVVETWTFDGNPANNHFPLLRKIKRAFAVDTDFYGNHGMFHEEKLRRLDRGKGLHGVTFEVTQEKFKLLQERCHKMEADQNQAIDEAAHELNLKKKESSDKIRNYSLEHESRRIYHHEIEKAKKDHREPRLYEFSLTPSPYAHTCKRHVLDLLKDIITPHQLNRISGTHPAITRMSGSLERIYLHSAGPLHDHQSSSGNVLHFRENNDARLYWTLPPQEFEALSQETKDWLTIPDHQRHAAKNIIRQLQSLEWFLLNSILDEQHHELRDTLINKTIELYEAFALIDPEKPLVKKTESISSWHLFSKHKQIDDVNIVTKLDNAKKFINSILMSLSHDPHTDQRISAFISLLDEKDIKVLSKLLGGHTVSLQINEKLKFKMKQI